MDQSWNSLCPGCFKQKEPYPVCNHCGYNENAPRSSILMPHRTLLAGKYLVGKMLGKGGFGITYLGYDISRQLVMAIKEYMPDGIAGRTVSGGVAPISDKALPSFFLWKEKFLEEGRLQARFNHPNIVRVENIFEDNNGAYIVMKFVEGVDLLKQVQLRGAPFTEDDAMAIIFQVIDAIQEIHSQRVIHRDIKPQNIFLTVSGRVILLDFGAAREAISDANLTLTEIYTDGFAAPEQYTRKGQGPWTDIYCICATLFFLLTGAVPSTALERQIKEDIDGFSVLKSIVNYKIYDAIVKGMSLKAENRPQDVFEMRKMLLQDGAISVQEKKSIDSEIVSLKQQTSTQESQMQGGSSQASMPPPLPSIQPMPSASSSGDQSINKDIPKQTPEIVYSVATEVPKVKDRKKIWIAVLISCLLVVSWLGYKQLSPSNPRMSSIEKKIDQRDMRLLFKEGSKYGFMDTAGKIIIAPKYDYAFRFVDKIGRVGLKKGNSIVWGLVDIHGNSLTDLAYSWPGTPAEDRISFSSVIAGTSKVGYWDYSGKIVIQPNFDYGSAFSDGVAVVGVGKDILRNTKWGLIDKNGKFIIEPRWSSKAVYYNLHDDIVEAKFANGLMPLRDETTNLAGYIDKTGTWVIKPQFAEARSFSDGMAIVGVSVDENGKKVKKFGYINTAGSLIIAPKFAVAQNFSDELALVAEGNDYKDYKFGFIDKKGVYKISPVYNSAQVSRVSEQSYVKFKEGVCPIALSAAGLKRQGNWRYIDKTGTPVLFQDSNELIVLAGEFDNGYAYVEIVDPATNKRMSKYIDNKGNLISPQISNTVNAEKRATAQIEITKPAERTQIYIERINVSGTPGAEKINAQLKQWETEFLKSHDQASSKQSLSVSYNLHLIQPGVLSITMGTSFANRGGQPIGGLRGATFNTQTGELLNLEQLLQWDNEMRQKANRVINQQIQEKQIPLLSREAVQIKPSQNFYLKPDGIVVFFFQKYEIAPGSMGTISFEVPLGWKL